MLIVRSKTIARKANGPGHSWHGKQIVKKNAMQNVTKTTEDSANTNKT